MLLVPIACSIIFSFSVVITADFWRNYNTAYSVFVELEPKKTGEKSTDDKNDLNEDLKEKFQNKVDAVSITSSILNDPIDQLIGSLPSAHLQLPDLPPELV